MRVAIDLIPLYGAYQVVELIVDLTDQSVIGIVGSGDGDKMFVGVDQLELFAIVDVGLLDGGELVPAGFETHDVAA